MVLKENWKDGIDAAAARELLAAGVIEVGVDSARMEYKLYTILNVIKNVVLASGGESVVITPAYGGGDSLQSDIFNVLIVDMGCKADIMLAYNRLEGLLGPEYDLKLEQSLIKIRYDLGRGQIF